MNLGIIFNIRVGVVEKVFNIAGQRSRSQRDQIFFLFVFFGGINVFLGPSYHVAIQLHCFVCVILYFGLLLINFILIFLHFCDKKKLKKTVTDKQTDTHANKQTELLKNVLTLRLRSHLLNEYVMM